MAVPRKYFTYQRPGKTKAGQPRPSQQVLKLLKGQVAGYQRGKGFYAKAAVPKPPPRPGKPPVVPIQNYDIRQFTNLLQGNQDTALTSLLDDSRKRSQAEEMSLAGFGAAMQGYSDDLWDQTAKSYQDAAVQQQGAATGLGGQVASGVAGMAAEQAALAGQLGYTGGTDLPTPEQAQAQVASEGGRKSSQMLAEQGKAWGGYGATRPEYIGFMTGQNQMQVERERMQGDQALRAKFAEMGMDNPKTAVEMWGAMQENRRQNTATSIAYQTLKTNVAMQRAKIKQDYQEMRARAKTNAEKLALDKEEARQNWLLDQQDLQIDQQNANSRGISAQASMTSAQASAARAATAKWKAAHPAAAGKAAGYAGGTYQQKVALAMKNVADVLQNRSAKKGSLDFAFAEIWPQMSPYISKANQDRAKKLLRHRIGTFVATWQPKAASGGGDESW